MGITKRWMAGAMMTALVMGVLAACSSKSGTEPSPSPSGAAATAAASAAPEKPIEITWANIYPPNDDNSKVQQYLEKKFNVKIKNVRIDRSNWDAQFNVKIAAGEVPDIIPFAAAGTPEAYKKQGIIANVSVDEIRKYMPKYIASIEAIDPLVWERAAVDGKNYGIPRIFSAGSTPFLPIYRADWMKAVGATEPPKTIQELEDLLYKFRNNDPDGNGKKDTYGLDARGKDALGTNTFSVVFGAFGINSYSWLPDKDGKLQFGMVTEQARQAFKLLAKWYKDGVLDPEFVTEDAAKLQQNIAGSRVGYIDAGLWYHYIAGGAYETPFKKANPNVELVVGPLLSGPNGPGVGYSFGIKQYPIAFGVQLEKDEKKRIKIYQMMEALATDDEVYLMATYGEKGVDWEMKNGVPAMINADYNDVIKRGAALGAGNFYSYFTGASPLMDKYSYSQEQLAQRDKWTKGQKTIENRYPLNAKPKAEHPNLDKMQKEYYLKFILGEVDLDKGFDDFVAQWRKEGGDDLTEAANIAYQANNKTKY
ncbi:MAG: extracellular solute-binding protein [Paenibacillaceae bacterium]|nr:extracellular solute-binding protein [Paenibacillaceae bacterium]